MSSNSFLLNHFFCLFFVDVQKRHWFVVSASSFESLFQKIYPWSLHGLFLGAYDHHTWLNKCNLLREEFLEFQEPIPFYYNTISECQSHLGLCHSESFGALSPKLGTFSLWVVEKSTKMIVPKAFTAVAVRLKELSGLLHLDRKCSKFELLSKKC